MKKGSGVITKIVLVLILVGLAAGGWYIYQDPEARTAIEDARWITKHREPDLYKDVEWMDGEIVKVLDGNWVFVKIPEGFVYGLRIRGLEAPTLALLLTDDTLKMGQEAKKFLEELVLKKAVRFQSIDMNELRYGHGYIEFEDQSIVLPMIKAGMARLNRTEITHLPFDDLRTLLQAEREAQEAALGIWDPNLDLEWTMGDFSKSAGAPGI